MRAATIRSRGRSAPRGAASSRAPIASGRGIGGEPLQRLDVATSRPPSTASSESTTPNRSPSHGPPIRTKSSLPSGEGTKCWIRSTRRARMRASRSVDDVVARRCGIGARHRPHAVRNIAPFLGLAYGTRLTRKASSWWTAARLKRAGAAKPLRKPPAGFCGSLKRGPPPGSRPCRA